MQTTARGMLLAAACATLAAFCSPTSADDASVAAGSWGGDHLLLDVTSLGATAEFDCAHGTVDAPLTLDSSGRFDLPGTFTREQPGPTRQDESMPTLPARYRGVSANSTLTLTVMLTDSQETVGAFTVQHGVEPRLTKCK